MNPFESGTTFGFAFSRLLCLCFRQCQVTGMPVKMVRVRHCLVDIVYMYCSAKSQVARLVLDGAVAVKVTWFSGTHVTRCCDAERCCCVKGGTVAYTGGTN